MGCKFGGRLTILTVVVLVALTQCKYYRVFIAAAYPSLVTQRQKSEDGR
jgi:hypothetical protein